MQSRHLNQPNHPIPLEPSFLPMHGRQATEAAIRRIVRSVRFELIEEANAVRLLGPEMSYHLADPYLSEVLPRFEPGLTRDGILSYRSESSRYDLCFEDSWSGYFIARQRRPNALPSDLVLIHLDDHADMMPTLLCQSSNGLIDPATSAVFDPRLPQDWESAIHSGAVSIGNFITPLYFSGSNVHVRHLNNANNSDLSYISHELCQYDLIPSREFAAISKSSEPTPSNVGTYRSSASSDEVLNDIPQGQTIVHIDLDYFINDFNGASREKNYIPDPMLQTEARLKMDRFFHTLSKLKPTIDRWIIATSPGFCCACHWEWLLSELERNIERFTASQGR